MMKIGRILASAMLAWIACGVMALPAQAQQRPSPLKISFQNVTAAHDSARAKKPATLPGDTLRYAITFLNNQPRALLRVVFKNPIPRGLRLLPGTVTTSAPAKVEYSIDGGVTYSERPTVTVTQAGQRLQQPAPPEAYTHIRWTVADSVAPRGSVTARYDVRLGQNP